jgi:hypothetical protein
MTLDLRKFFQATNPSKTLFANDAEEDQKYYVDFSSVRGGQIIEDLKNTITLFSPDAPTCQLFTGNIGCGKSTELRRLKVELEREGFHVIYFESSQDLEMADVEVSDILLSIARRVSESLENLRKIEIDEPRGLQDLLRGAAKLLQTEIEISAEPSVPGISKDAASTEGKFSVEAGIAGVSQVTASSEEVLSLLALRIGKIIARTKESPIFRAMLRGYLDPRINWFLEAINKELLEPATEKLKQHGKNGLVVIVDNLDRLDTSPKPWGRPQPEYLFVDRGEELRQLNCHVIYNIPLALIFSNDSQTLTNRIASGVTPKMLPMVPVQLRNGSVCEEGMYLLRQMVLLRAFPNLDEEQRLSKITEVFDSPETLDRLCCVSGGHVRYVLRMLQNCIMKEMNLPISRNTLEEVIREERNQVVLAVTDDDWDLLYQVSQQKRVRGDEGYHRLIRRLFVYEYRDSQGFWFGLNPIFAEALEARKKQELLDSALAKAQQFLIQVGAVTSREERCALRVQSVPGRLKSYAPLPVMFTDQPVDQDIIELVQHAAQLGENRQQQAAILLYREPPDTLFRMRMAEVRLRDHFVLIPIPFAAVEQALTDEAASTGLIAQYAGRYLPGADLFDDRNAIGDTLCFFGRGNLLHSLEEDLRRNQGIGLFGLRKSGKTSLLLQLGFAMRQYPVVHIDLQPYGGKLRYGAELFNKILQELAQLLRKRATNSTSSFESFQRDCPAVDLTTDFSKQVSNLAKRLGEAGYQLPILVFLDEIERILPTEADSRKRAEEFNAFFGVLRALSQEQKLISLLIADVHPDVNRINHWSQYSVPTNPVFSFFKEVFVSLFSQEETTEMLTEIGKLMSVAFDEETLVAIHLESGGHPFIARQMASLLCKKADKEKSEQGELVKLSEAKRYLNRPFKHSGILKDYFEQNIWADLHKRNFASAMAILRLLACNEESAEGITEETLLERLSHDFTENECTDALLWLEAVGLVAREELEDDSYRIQVLLMSRWLRMQMKPEEIHQWQLP